MKKQILVILIFLILVITSCFVNQLKTVDDTEHLWIGKDGIEFYE